MMTMTIMSSDADTDGFGRTVHKSVFSHFEDLK